jgi:hypothetical protein
MDKIRRYDSEDYAQLCDWFAAHDLPSPKPNHLSGNGFICDGVAAGFLYMTDSAVCILDTYISNPKTDQEKRDRALNLITMHLIEFAKSVNFEVVLFSTSSDAVASRAKKFGFHEVRKETCYVKGI